MMHADSVRKWSELVADGVKGRRRRRRRRAAGLGLFASSAAVLLAGVVAVAGIWTLLTRLLRYHWPWDQRLSHGQAVSELDITKVALSVVAGVGAAIALTVTYRRQRDAERSRFDERFAAAAAQLGGDSPAERLAGVYAIATMADETPDRRQQCINLLCAYLRLPYDPAAGLLRTVVVENTWPAQLVTRREQRSYERLPNDREVRLTIIDVIRAHLQPDAAVPWHGYDFDFKDAAFDGGNFAGAQFSASYVDFRGARFTGGQVSFNGAEFSGGQVYFTEAQFSGGQVRFSPGALQAQAPPDLSYASFRGGVVWIGDTELAEPPSSPTAG